MVFWSAGTVKCARFRPRAVVWSPQQERGKKARNFWPPTLRAPTRPGLSRPGPNSVAPCRESCGKESDTRRSKYGCIAEAHKSTRKRTGKTEQKDHEDRIAGHGVQFIRSLQPCAQVQLLWTKSGKSSKKLPSWQMTKSKEQKEVIKEAQKEERTVHFATLMDICHLKISELEPKFQKYKGRVVLRGDIVRQDSGSYAVFTEEGSSASQMTAAKVMDVMARLPDWAGQAADAVSAYTHVKMEDAPTLLKIPKSECPDIWIRLPRHKWPKSWSSMEDPVVLLERNLYGHPLAGLLWERQFEKILLKYGREKVFQSGMLICAPSKRIILIYVCG